MILSRAGILCIKKVWMSEKQTKETPLQGYFAGSQGLVSSLVQHRHIPTLSDLCQVCKAAVLFQKWFLAYKGEADKSELI